MTRTQLFERAKAMALACPHPTTIEAQLAILAKRRRRYGHTFVVRTLERENVESPHYWWQRDDR